MSQQYCQMNIACLAEIANPVDETVGTLTFDVDTLWMPGNNDPALLTIYNNTDIEEVTLNKILVDDNEEWWYFFAYNGQNFSLDEEVNIVIPRGQSIQLEVHMNIWAKEMKYPVLYFENTLETVSLVTALDWTESVSEQVKNSTLIYPNPSNGTFNLNLGEGQWNVEVYDITGRKVYETRMDGRSVLDLGSCQKGMYFLKATEGDRSMTTKIVVD